jgi:hypothetical protein
MSEPRDVARLLRWYPAPWRARYGDELAALMEDEAEGQRLTRRRRVSIAVAGLRERGHGARLLVGAGSPGEIARAGVLLVLAAWAAFLVAGSSYAKLAEHFEGAFPRPDRPLADHAFTAVEAAATVAGALFVAGVLLALPAFVRFLRAGGWAAIRRPAAWAAVASAVALGGAAALIPWAHSLSDAARNGADSAYSAGFLGVACVGTVALALWTRVAARSLLGLTLHRRLLWAESALAIGIAAAMGVVTVATAIWWGSVAMDAPWFLHGSRRGTGGSPFNPQVTSTVIVMALALVVAMVGVACIGRSWTTARRGRPVG